MQYGKKINKSYQVEKEEIRLLLVTDYLSVYIEKKESMDQLLIREFSKAVRYKINT